MTRDEIKSLQKGLGVAADGMDGRNTYRALFARMGADVVRSIELGLAANVHFRTYGINETPRRLQHFMAQVAHESGGFRYMEEIWGPTPAQKRYEGRADLGNVVPGDGKRYQGRGPIQLTGRANYRDYGQTVGIDIESHPEVVAMPSFGLLIACMYWDRNKLNALADADDIKGITGRINGGLNGFEDRKARFSKVRGFWV